MMAIDMLDELMKSDKGFTEEQMVDFLLALLVAGYETTPAVMTLVVKFVTETPQALVLLKEEHDAIRASKKNESNPLDWDDYNVMRFTQCVTNETLRVANVVSGVFRRATTDIHYKEYTIPKGCKSFRAVHMDLDTNFKDARTFNPWRWQKEDRIIDAPDLLADYYLNLLDWGSKNILCIALGNTVYLWNGIDGSTDELMSVDDDIGPITSVCWAPDGHNISIGLNSSHIKIWDAVTKHKAII